MNYQDMPVFDVILPLCWSHLLWCSLVGSLARPFSLQNDLFNYGCQAFFLSWLAAFSLINQIIRNPMTCGRLPPGSRPLPETSFWRLPTTTTTSRGRQRPGRPKSTNLITFCAAEFFSRFLFIESYQRNLRWRLRRRSCGSSSTSLAPRWWSPRLEGKKVWNSSNWFRFGRIIL